MHFSCILPETEKTYQYTKEEWAILQRCLPTGDYNLLIQGRGIPELATLVQIDGYSTALLPRYLMQMRYKGVSAEEAVRVVNNNEDYIPASELDW